MRLLPKREKFFDYLNRQSELIAKAGALLHQAAQSNEAGRVAAFEQIERLEVDGDSQVLEIFRRLNRTFLTPIDAEDIHLLASHLDDILDGLEESAYRLAYYHLDPIPPAAVQMCEILDRTCAKLSSAVRAIGDHGNVLDECVAINRYEDEIDKLLRDSLRALFETEKDAINLIKIKEVLEILEETADRCEDVSAAVQTIVVKNS